MTIRLFTGWPAASRSEEDRVEEGPVMVSDLFVPRAGHQCPIDNVSPPPIDGREHCTVGPGEEVAGLM